MRLGWILAIVCAVLVHVGILLFAGILFPRHDAKNAANQTVDLLSNDDVEKDKEKPEEPKPDKQEELEPDAERPPDPAEVMRSLEPAPVNDAPALEAASLSAIEAALNGQGGGGDFASMLDFSSGGVLNGKGKGGALEQSIEEAFNLTDIDQKPRAVVQGAPVYPNAMRGKKVEGVVTLIFVVDPDGKVLDPRVEKSSNAAFDDPALAAVKKWKFEPGLRAGQRVPCKMRVPIRFPPS